jgi:hypothetical protein
MFLSKFIPYEKYVLVTNLTSKEVLKAISEILLTQNNSDASYDGRINGNTFKAIRNNKRFRSFSPMIRGNVSTASNKTEISIKMTLPIYTAIFLLAWTGFFGVGCFKVLYPGLFNLREEDKPIWFLPFLFLLVTYLMVIFSFKSESKKAREYLEMSLAIIEIK